MDPRTWDVPFPVVVGAMFVIVFCRAGGTYWLGRAATAGVRRTRIATLMDSSGYRRAARLVNEYGAPVVAASFLTIGFQTLANLSAGATKMPLGRYLPALAVGGAAWAFIYSTIGLVGVELFGRLWATSPALAVGIGVAALAGFAGYVRWRRRRAVAAED